jgi:hypothetical protein
MMRKVELDAVLPQTIHPEDAFDPTPRPDAAQIIAPDLPPGEQECVIQEKTRRIVDLEHRLAAPRIIHRFGADHWTEFAAQGLVKDRNRGAGVDEEAPILPVFALHAEAEDPLRAGPAVETGFRRSPRVEHVCGEWWRWGAGASGQD